MIRPCLPVPSLSSKAAAVSPANLNLAAKSCTFDDDDLNAAKPIANPRITYARLHAIMAQRGTVGTLATSKAVRSCSRMLGRPVEYPAIVLNTFTLYKLPHLCIKAVVLACWAASRIFNSRSGAPPVIDAYI